MKEGYLYDQGPISYPIQEYKPDPSLKKRPSFVVDTSYPRLVQFYHPTSPICQSFQTVFIDTGRIFRSDNNDEYNQHQNQRQRHDKITTEAATVTFHAVNCAAHMDVCASPEFAIHAVPVLLAFSKGSEKGRVVKRTEENQIVLDYVADILGVKLHGGHGGAVSVGGHRHQRPFQSQVSEQSRGQNENEALIQGIRGRSGEKNGAGIVVESDDILINGNTGGDDSESYSGMGEMSEEEVAKEMMRRDATNKRNTVVFAAHAGNHDQIVMKQDRNSLTQIKIFEDAATSFLITLEQNIYPSVEIDENLHQKQYAKEHGSQKALPPLSTKRSDILRDFLDLCHWALPSSWVIHGHINELRNNFSTITKHRRSLQNLLDQLDRPSSLSSTTWEWSDDCKIKSSSVTDGNKGSGDFGIDAEMNRPYQCGMWKFFHILSIGIVEQRTNVMGDQSRVSPSYAAWVVRDFVEAFLVDEETMKITNTLKILSDDEKQEASVISQDGDISSTHNSKGPRIWCKGCRNSIIHSYDQCLYGLCSRDFNDVRMKDQRHSQKYHHKRDNREWKKVAEWLWRVHNNVHYFKDRKIKSDEISNDPQPLSWPSRSECIECYRKGGVISNLPLPKVKQLKGRNKSLPMHWNSDAMYDYLKNVYWPTGVQNPRVIIMKQENFGGRRMQSFQTVSSNMYYTWKVPFVLLILWSWVKRRKFCKHLVSYGKKRISNSPPPFNPYNDSYSFHGQAHTKQRVGKVNNGIFMHHTFLD